MNFSSGWLGFFMFYFHVKIISERYLWLRAIYVTDVVEELVNVLLPRYHPNCEKHA